MHASISNLKYPNGALRQRANALYPHFPRMRNRVTKLILWSLNVEGRAFEEARKIRAGLGEVAQSPRSPRVSPVDNGYLHRCSFRGSIA